MPVQINGKMRDRIDVPAEASEEEIRSMALGSEIVQKCLEGRKPRKIIVAQRKCEHRCISYDFVISNLQEEAVDFPIGESTASLSMAVVLMGDESFLVLAIILQYPGNPNATVLAGTWSYN